MNSRQGTEINSDRASRISADESTKLPFDLAVPTIEQIVSEIIPKKLDLLEQHKRNARTASTDQDHPKAKKEILKGSLIVRQIKKDIANLQEIKRKLHESHHEAFDNLVGNIVNRASTALAHFNEEERRQRSAPVEPETNDVEERCTPKLQILQHQSDLEEMQSYANSVEKIQQDCRDIHSAYQTLAHIVAESAETVDKVEENIVKTEEDVKRSERHLAYCARKSLALTSVMGAVAGVCVGGPIGLVLGAKVAAVAALGGGFLGFSGAQVFKKRRQRELDVIDTRVSQLES